VTSEPLKTKQDSDHDRRTFDERPAKTKELVALEDHAEKATGPTSVMLTAKIREQ